MSGLVSLRDDFYDGSFVVGVWVGIGGILGKGKGKGMVRS